MTKPHKRRLLDRENFGLLCVMPWFIGFLMFTLYPFLSSLYLSFTNATLLREPVFVGLQNYLYMFTRDSIVPRSLGITFVYTVVSVPLKLGFALLIAMLLNQRIRGIGFFRTVYYLPSIVGSSVAMAAVWRGLFAFDGIINTLLMKLDLPRVMWLTEPVPANAVIILLTVWQFGSSMVIFLAALKGIPQELYEAAYIDGASKFMGFFKITLPQLTPVVFFNFVMQMINGLQEFSAPMLITNNGGPMKSTYLFGLKLYEEGFRFSKMGYASALSWVLFIIILILTSIAFRYSGWVHYEDGGRT